MTTTTQLTDNKQQRTKTLAAGALGLSGAILLGVFLAGAEAGYESVLFVWTHVFAMIAAGLVAAAGTAILYADGSRRLGLAGLLGTGFAWIATGMAALWVPIAWQATVFTQTGSSSLETYLELFSPFGSAYFLVYSLLVGAGVAGLGMGFVRTDLVHRPVAGFATLVGGVSVVWMLYALATAMANPLEGTAVTIPLFVVLWVSVSLLGGSLFVKNRSDYGETSADDAASAD